MAAGIAQASAASLRPSPTPVVDVKTTYWSTVVADPYRWLEDAASQKVSRWIDAQNRYADAVFATYAQRTAIAKLVRRLSIIGPQRFEPKIAAGNLFYLRQIPPQQQPVLVEQPWPEGRPRVLVDPNPAGGLLSIEGYWPSPDARHVAYATQEAGAEATEMHVLEARSGRALSETLPRVGGGASTDALAWDADGRGFVYTRVPAPGSVPKGQEYFNSALFHHRLGSPARADTVALGRGFSPVAEWNAMDTADGRAAALVHYGDGSYNDVYVRSGLAWRKAVAAGTGVFSGSDETRVTSAAFVGQKLFVIETAGSPKGRVVAIDGASSRTILPEGDWAIRAIAPVRGGFLISEVLGPDWRVRHFARNGAYVRTVALPKGAGVDDVVGNAAGDDALIAFSGWSIATRWVRYDGRTGAVSRIFALEPAADYSGLEFTRIDAVSKDGMRVPVTVIHRRGMPADGRAAGVLTAYGGYGLETRPSFVGPWLAWIERGGVYAVANIRGGGEFGEAWHLDGRLTKKQNDYDDFTACARALVSSGWVARGRLGIVGGSNGGLLMGAALTQHPELYRAVVSFAGDYDMLRVELTPNGRYNVSEFGSVNDEKQFEALLGYSPYHNVRKGVAYPAVLMIAGENDPRVNPWQSRKMIARLQAADAAALPIMLFTRRSAGHGIGASFSQRLGDRAAEFIFLFNELGVRE